MQTVTQQLNTLIQTLNSQGILDTSQVSDGQHTFAELYAKIKELEQIINENKAKC